MDATSVGGRVQEWVHDCFEGRTKVSTADLASQSHASGLPEEARWAIGALPQRDWTADEAVHAIVDVLETHAGGGERGDGNVPGPGGYGRSR